MKMSKNSTPSITNNTYGVTLKKEKAEQAFFGRETAGFGGGDRSQESGVRIQED